MQSELLADPRWTDQAAPTRRAPGPDHDKRSGQDRMEPAQEFLVEWEVPEHS